jgi:hypothetical protein
VVVAGNSVVLCFSGCHVADSATLAPVKSVHVDHDHAETAAGAVVCCLIVFYPEQR